jgi:hypothetical protein
MVGALIACSPPDSYQRLGEPDPVAGFVVGAGRTTNGLQWLVGLKDEGGEVCHRLVVDGRLNRPACSEANEAGTNSVTAAPTGAEPVWVAGFTDGSVARIEITTTVGTVSLPVVDLAPTVWPGGAFGVVVPSGLRVNEVRFLDADGNLVKRVPLGVIAP